MRAVVPIVEAGPDFGDLDPDVQAFIAIVAAENKTGKISPARIATVRRELFDALDRVGDRAAFAFGVREAIRRGAGSVNYAIKAASSYSPLMARVVPAGSLADVPETIPAELRR